MQACPCVGLGNLPVEQTGRQAVPTIPYTGNLFISLLYEALLSRGGAVVAHRAQIATFVCWGTLPRQINDEGCFGLRANGNWRVNFCQIRGSLLRGNPEPSPNWEGVET